MSIEINLPVPGEQPWGDKLNTAIETVRGAAVEAQSLSQEAFTKAEVAEAQAIAAQDAAVAAQGAVAATEAAASAAQDAAESAEQVANSAAAVATSAASSAADALAALDTKAPLEHVHPVSDIDATDADSGAADDEKVLYKDAVWRVPPPPPPPIFEVTYDGEAWSHTSLADAQADGLQSGQIVFVTGPGDVLPPAWLDDHDGTCHWLRTEATS